eukprot:scaffold3450_cov323-Prasinococcus_capsulatus_cf.AAC.2
MQSRKFCSALTSRSLCCSSPWLMSMKTPIDEQMEIASPCALTRPDARLSARTEATAARGGGGGDAPARRWRR